MSVISFIALAVICVSIATPASADVTLHLKRTETDFGGRVIDSTEYRKGLKIRTDSSGDGIASVSMIVDAATGQGITLWHDSKTAEVVDLTQTVASLHKNGAPEVKQSITPTGESRQIAGSTCTVYDVKTSFRRPNMERAAAMIIVMEGSMCLVRNGPGQAEFSAHSRAMAERALVSDPMREIQRQTAEVGVPFATRLTVRIGGGGPTGEMPKEAGTYTTEVTSVSTAPIANSLFEIPADYRVTKR